MCASLSAAVATTRRTRAIEANGSLAHTTRTCDPTSCHATRSIESMQDYRLANGSLTPTRALFQVMHKGNRRS
jgi:hypothetical protein